MTFGVRIYNSLLTDFSDSQELQGNEATLIGYWKLNNTYTDSTGNTTLTTANTPTFSTDVPFSTGSGGTPTTTLYTYTYATSTHTQRQYIGEYYQPESELSYLNARWYDGERGRFLSQDPVFLAIGNQSQLQQLTKQNQQQFLLNPQQLNSYSYAQNNPIVKKDPDGNFAMAIPYAVITAPEWVPWVVGGIVATYLAADMALRNSGSWGTRWGGAVPTLDPAKMGFGPPPMGPEDWRPNLDNKPPWMKIAVIGTIGSAIVNEIARPIYNLYQSLTNRGPQAAQLLNQQFNSSSVQTRVQATQAYNAATGASTPQQKLWVTPNGTVITWSGQIIAPAPSNSSDKK